MSSAADLGPARQLVTVAGLRAGLGEQRAQQLATALSEVATNALQHGGGTAIVDAYTLDDVFVVSVYDPGGGSTAPAVPPDRPAPTRSHGRGLWLADQLCDRVEIAWSRHGTTVRLIMRLDPAER